MLTKHPMRLSRRSRNWKADWKNYNALPAKRTRHSMPSLQKSGTSDTTRNGSTNDVRNACVAEFVDSKDAHGISFSAYKRAGPVLRESATCVVRKRAPTASPTVIHHWSDQQHRCSACFSSQSCKEVRRSFEFNRGSATCKACGRCAPRKCDVCSLQKNADDFPDGVIHHWNQRQHRCSACLCCRSRKEVRKVSQFDW